MSLNNKSEEKQRLRDRLLALRKNLPPDTVCEAGFHVARNVLEWRTAAEARTVCVYASMGKEIPTRELIRHLLMDGKVVAVPDWKGWKQGSGMRLAAIRGEQDLVTEGRVVPQPLVTPGNNVSVWDVDLFVVPGLAFDGSGNRLGMGGGYFDRLLALASSQATFLGLAYGFQMIDRLPWEPHDIPVHQVVTPGSGFSEGWIDK